VHQQINFGRRKIRRQIVPPDNLEKEAECVYRLLNREVGARGEIDSLADSIFDGLADGHLVRLNFFRGESFDDLGAVPCVNDLVEELQL
jgi:hypothetical protein